MDLIAYLLSMGLDRPAAALCALSGAFAALVLPGIALCSVMERRAAHRACPVSRATPRGATRLNPGQP